MIILALLAYLVTVGAASERDDKQFSVFNVIRKGSKIWKYGLNNWQQAKTFFFFFTFLARYLRFPNDVCTSASSTNGTCYTASECTSLGGTSSGSCASSFGVCCVFNIACGGTTSANNSYATITSFSTTSDSDPCTYTYCKNSEDVCKLR